MHTHPRVAYIAALEEPWLPGISPSGHTEIDLSTVWRMEGAVLHIVRRFLFTTL